MLPVRDDVPTRTAPIAVIGLVAANAAAFALLLSLGSDDLGPFVDRFALVPRELLRGGNGASVWLTPFTSMFLHAGLLHLAGNLLYLWVFGTAIEDLVGHVRLLVLYLASGLAGSALHVAAEPSSFIATVGASGAVSGLLGAYAVSYPTGRLRLLWPPVSVPAVFFLAVWVVFQLLSGLSGEAGVAWWAHLGGFATGATLARAMWTRRPLRSRLRI